MSTRDLVNLIKAVGKHPLERDTLYNVLHDYTNETFKEDEVINSYVSLPVVNNQ
jgi:aminodeoxyfutalosine synthase